MATVTNGTHKSSLAERLNISIEKLDTRYIEKSDDVKELEKILKILRSGEEGQYPHLEQLCEDKLTALAPKSRVLRKSTKLLSTNEVTEKEEIVDDLKAWTAEVSSLDSVLKTAGHGGGGDELPPVRNQTQLVGKTAEQPKVEKKTKKVAPRDYKEWDKIISNLDDHEEPEQVEKPAEDMQMRKPSRSLTNHINTDGMTSEEKTVLANREKDKGNEAFRSGDLMEAIAYYNRSLSVLPITATYNNRALAYIRASKWSDAVGDCNRVLNAEPGNIKARLRRACAYKSLRKFKLANDDLEMVLEAEPLNKRAKDIMKEVSKEIEAQEKRRSEGKGNRMVIEETDGESDQEVEVKEEVNSSVDTANTEPVSQPRRITIEEDTDDGSSGAGDSPRLADDSLRPNTDSSASSGVESSVDSIDSSSSSPKDKLKSASRNNSLLNIIQQNMSTPSTGQPTSCSPDTPASLGEVSAKRETSPPEVTSEASAKRETLPPEVTSEASAERETSPPEVASEASAERETSLPEVASEAPAERETSPPEVSSEASAERETSLPEVASEAPAERETSLPEVANEASAERETSPPEVSSEASAERETSPPEVASEAPAERETSPPEVASEASAERETSPPEVTSEASAERETSPPEVSSEAPAERETSPPEVTSEAPAERETSPPEVASEASAERETSPPEVSSEANHNNNSVEIKERGDKAEIQEPILPKVVKVPQLSSAADKLKSKGNELFKNGQYSDAAGYYTEAIKSLQQSEEMAYHVATLYSNRSACHIKTGNCRAAVEDSTTALQLVPDNSKALLRRATANEMLERWMDAYVDFRHIINIDSSASNAYAGANRCEKMMSNEHGRKWREKLPKIPSCANLTQYEVEGAKSTPTNTAPPPAVVKPLPSEPVKVSQPEPVVESNEEKFNRLKEMGNKRVAKGDYTEASKYYTEAIDLYPDRVAPYSNRALCLLKLNQPLEAIKDCDTVLGIEPAHLKAMFRRAQANKMLEKFKDSLADLMNLLKLESHNTAAKKELEAVKVAYRKQLQELQAKTAKASPASQSTKQSSSQAKQTTPKATRVVIEECSDSDEGAVNGETPNPVTTPRSNPSKSSKSRQKKRKQAAKKAAANKVEELSSHSTPTVPTLSANPTAYEFTQAWTALRHKKDTEPYAQLLRQIPPSRLSAVVSNKLEAEMLEKIIFSLDNHFTADEMNNVELYLKSLTTVPRFAMVAMFMSDKCKAALESLLTKLKPISSQVDKLKIAFRV